MDQDRFRGTQEWPATSNNGPQRFASVLVRVSGWHAASDDNGPQAQAVVSSLAQ